MGIELLAGAGMWCALNRKNLLQTQCM